MPSPRNRVAILIDRASNSATQLADSLNTYRVRPERASRVRYPLFVNWGVSSGFVTRAGVRVLNRPEAVNRSISKLSAFNALAGKDYCPEVRTSIPAERDAIWFARRDGLSGGAGITVVRRRDAVPTADMYVRYIKKTAEYRVHVFNGRAILTQQKLRRNNVERTEDQLLIRSHANGWVFSAANVSYPSDAIKRRLEAVAIDAVRTLGLDFAAVDLVLEKDTNNVFFLETNTRPGIEAGATINAYTSAILEAAGSAAS